MTQIKSPAHFQSPPAAVITPLALLFPLQLGDISNALNPQLSHPLILKPELVSFDCIRWGDEWRKKTYLCRHL